MIYQKAAETYTKPLEYFLLQRNKEKALDDEEDDEDELVEGPTEKVTKEEMSNVTSENTGNNQPITQQQTNFPEDDILGMANNSLPNQNTANNCNKFFC